MTLVLLASCRGESSCETERRDPGCPDLRFSGELYDEWRETHPGPVLQELGDAAYPACNDAERCGPDLGGFAATDVWMIEGVDFEHALMGYRQGTETVVIFVRRGTDPDEVPGLRQAVQ